MDKHDPAFAAHAIQMANSEQLELRTSQGKSRQPPPVTAVGLRRLVHIAMRRARFVARFIYWSFRHGSTANAGWVCNYEGLYW